MSKITTSDFQKGKFIEFKNEPCQIVEYQFVNPGKGSAFVRTKLKNLKSGRVQEFTYKSGEVVEEIPVSAKEMQFLYKQNEELIFMDPRTFEQVSLPLSYIGSFSKFIKEGDIYQVLVYDGQALGMRYPQKVRLKIIEADEGAKGDTVMGAKKIVTLETNVKVAVPLFVKQGETIIVDSDTGEYVGRESQKNY